MGETIFVREWQHGTGKSSGVETELTDYAAWTFRDAEVVRIRWETGRPSALEAARPSE